MSFPRVLIVVFLSCVSGYTPAQQAQPASPGSENVVARVYTEDRERLRQLGEDHELWYYIWREGYAVIHTERARLPYDAVIDSEATSALLPDVEPYRGTGTLPARPCYRTVEQTYADLAALAANNPQLAQWLDFGDSWEKTQAVGGYDLQALSLSNSAVAGPKPLFMVMAASHARELATAESVTRFAESLVSGYGVDPDITWMLDYFEVQVIPVHNPDGRKMAEAQCTSGCSPSWRKNTNTAYCGPASANRGADLNRNAGNSFWGGPWSSSNQCSETYRGPSASSEPETSDLESHAQAMFPDYRDAAPNDFTTAADADADGVFISVHSAGDIVFYPWEGSDDAPPNLAGLRALAQKMGFATTFAACQNCFLGPASGTNVDFIYEKLGIPAYTYEIGTSFGQSCSSFESTVLPQTTDGLMTALKHSRRPYRSSLGPDVIGISFVPGPGGGTLSATADDSRRAVNDGGEPVDGAQNIAEVRYTVGEPPWLASASFPLEPQDGAFDEAVEAAFATIDDDAVNGTELVYVYAIDASGDTGPPSAVWVTFGHLLKSGFESP